MPVVCALSRAVPTFKSPLSSKTCRISARFGRYAPAFTIRKRLLTSRNIFVTFGRHDTHILATNSQGTVLFSLDRPDNISAVPPEIMHFDSSPTLAASNVARRFKNTSGRTSYEDSPFVVQVTEDNVLLLEYDNVLQVHSVLTSWSPTVQGGDWTGRKIVAAALNPSQFVLGLSRKRLVVLNLSEDNKFQIFRYCSSLLRVIPHLTRYYSGIKTCMKRFLCSPASPSTLQRCSPSLLL